MIKQKKVIFLRLMFTCFLEQTNYVGIKLSKKIKNVTYLLILKIIDRNI